MSNQPPVPEKPQTQSIDQMMSGVKDQVLVGEMNLINAMHDEYMKVIHQLQAEVQRLNGALNSPMSGPPSNRTQRREQARAAKKSAKLKEKAEPKTTGHPKSIK